MTRDQLGSVTVTSDEEFEAVLAEVVRKAIEADVDVRGAWELRTDRAPQEWEVLISELASDLGDDD